MKEEQLRLDMRRLLDEVRPVDALRQYRAFTQSPSKPVDPGLLTLALAEEALAKLAQTNRSPSVTSSATRKNRLASIVACAAGFAALVLLTIHPNARIGEKTPNAVVRQDPNAHLTAGDSLYETGSFEAALAEDGLAYQIALHQGDAGAQATARTYMGRDSQALGRLSDARESYSEALQLRRITGPSISIAYVEETLGGLDTMLGDYSPAEEALNDSLSRRLREKDAAGVIECQRDLAEIKLARGEPMSAILLLNEAQSAARNLNKPDMVAAADGQLGTANAATGDLDAAQAHLSNALAYWHKRGHPRWIATIECRLSDVRLKCGDAIEAKKLAEGSLLRYRQVGDKYGQAKAELAEAKALLRMDNTPDVQRLLASALSYSLANNLKPLEQEVRSQMQ